MRLIDADAIKYTAMFTDYADGRMTSDAIVTKDEIDELPTIDPVKHGKLIASEETNSGGLIRMVCSECNRVVYSTYGVRLGGIQFCPYCGAKMEASDETY